MLQGSAQHVTDKYIGYVTTVQTVDMPVGVHSSENENPQYDDQWPRSPWRIKKQNQPVLLY